MLEVDPKQVYVLLYDSLPEHWGVGGQTKAAHESAIVQQQKEVGE